jgi:hypothetical protein
MKPVNQNNAKKLNLQKKVISHLSYGELGGANKGRNEAAWTTSFDACSGFLCCPSGSIDVDGRAIAGKL